MLGVADAPLHFTIISGIYAASRQKSSGESTLPEEMQSSFDSAAASQFLEALFRSKPEDHYICLWTLPAVGGKSVARPRFFLDTEMR